MPEKKKSNSKGEISVGLRRRLGEELAEMFDSVGRKLYGDLRDRMRSAIAEGLREHRDDLQDAIKEEFGRRGAAKAEEHVSEWLDEVVGDSVHSVAREVFEDLESIADSMLEEARDKEEGEEEGEEEEVEEEEVEEEEVEEEDKKGKGRKAFLEKELSEIKAEAQALAKRMAATGDSTAIDNAAFIKMAVSDL